MFRTTVLLPDDLASKLDDERRREDTSATEIIRRALTRYFGTATQGRRKLPFAALGRSGHRDTSERAEELLGAAWGGRRVRGR